MDFRDKNGDVYFTVPAADIYFIKDDRLKPAPVSKVDDLATYADALTPVYTDDGLPVERDGWVMMGGQEDDLNLIRSQQLSEQLGRLAGVDRYLTNGEF